MRGGPLNKAACWAASGTALALLVATAPVIAQTGVELGAQPGAIGELDFLRRGCVAAARDTQQQERAVAALEHDIDLLGRDAAARKRGLDESRVEQGQLLGAIERLARNPPDRFAVVAETPIDRRRSLLLLDATVPALRTEARALSGEFARVAALHKEIAAKEGELPAARDALAQDRDHLAQLIARRSELERGMLPEEAGGGARIARLGHDARDIGDLIKRADAATDRRDEGLLARNRARLLTTPSQAPGGNPSAPTSDTADPTRPAGLRPFDPPHSALVVPVSGSISRRFGAPNTPPAAGRTTQGLGFAALPGDEVVAPFDGRAIYAGRFGNLGLILIIRHGGGYHSVLAGLGRVDVAVGEWVLAGEPVGAMPDTPPPSRPPQAEGRKVASGVTLYVELRRHGRPVDPEPWLAPRDEGRDEPDGDPLGADRSGGDQPGEDKKVRE